MLINGTWELNLPPHRLKQWSQDWEKKRLQKMYEEIKKDDVVLYAGVEEGDIPALISLWGAQVYLIEPQPKFWPNIKHVFELNNVEPLGCFAGFASDKTQTAPTPNFDTRTLGVWPLVAYGEVQEDVGFRHLYQETTTTPQIKLDSLLYVPDVIVLDVEGSEWQVLKGAQETLRVRKPKIFLSGHEEFMPYMFGQELKDLREWIKGFGYKETELDNQHELHVFYE
jgi:FkbM family methyltransferase